jgi:hypothetical protein
LPVADAALGSPYRVVAVQKLETVASPVRSTNITGLLAAMALETLKPRKRPKATDAVVLAKLV